MRFWRALTTLLSVACTLAALHAAASETLRSAIALNPLSKLDPASFKSFIERPLFSPDRRAAQDQHDDEKATTPQPADTFSIRLLGISVTPEGTTARIKDNSDGILHSLGVGDVFDEWHVDSIEADALAMSKDGDKRVYDLFARQDRNDKTSASANDVRSPATVSSTKSNYGDCAHAGINCDGDKRHKQDLVDFFGSSVK